MCPISMGRLKPALANDMSVSLTVAVPGAKRGTTPSADIVTVATTVGVVVVGAALIEAALIPGIVVGAAAILAPGMTSRRLPMLRRGLRSLFQRPVPPANAAAAPEPVEDLPGLTRRVLPRLHLGEAVAKTITYRVTVATLDFAWNYIILGEIGMAAGLSALNLGVGPIFYFVHESAWNYFGSPARLEDGSSAAGCETLPPARLVRIRGITIDRALAKTIAYETLGSAAEFTVNLMVVGDVVTAAIITAPLVIVGPFIYYGHEKGWDMLAAPTRRAVSSAGRRWKVGPAAYE